MTVRKFKLDMTDVPEELQRDDEGTPTLVLKIPTLTGKTKVIIKDQEIIKTDGDPLAEYALENYAPPRIPVKNKSQGGEWDHSVYDHDLHKDKRPFTEVASNSTYDHVV